ncbi:MAG: tRNA uridine-5-carboxymethylaminomethyl(34) synthesis GTPase MnmE [Candidatus Omnitrophota bacterium]|nr:tRNA uridine-5-carboxymethylaminomethyl(34) synthesis GTPase MnmE [Candidatus Omnitrophota bacterium]
MNNFKLKDYNLADTIAAPATYPGRSALGVIKISGKQAINIVSRVFLPRRKKNIKKVKSHTLHYGWIIESPLSIVHSPQKKQKSQEKNQKLPTIIDEVLISVMRGPASYTREDVVEISSHGGAVVINKILELVLGEGGRLALPGEFTYRALVKGRIDLLQAEGILSIVEAKSQDGLSLAALQLKGEASQKIRKIKEQLKDVFTQTEAFINFPEDEINIAAGKIKTTVTAIENQLSRLLEGSKQAQVLKEGARCVICGKTNVGKSTLFNCLLKQERVIVSKMPGTTRDVIEEVLTIKGLPLRIYDTAGLLEPQDFVTAQAIDRTMLLFNEADLIIFVLDGTHCLNKDDLFLLEKIKDKTAVMVINKADRKQKLSLSNIPNFKGPKVKFSALKNIGLQSLEEAIYNSICKEGLDRQDIVFLNQYQRQVLANSRDSLTKAARLLEEGYTIDFVNLALGEGLDNLGKLSGEVLSEEILENIFGKFCIGK